MKRLLFILLFAVGCIAARGQQAAADYERARAALQQHEIDSSLYYINRASRYFNGIRHFDSLALTLALEVQVVWEKETLAAAITKADSAMQSVLGKLPAKSEGRIALNSIKGSLYAGKFRFDSATIYYNRALQSADTLHPRLPLVILYMNLCRMEMLKEHFEKADHYYIKAYNTLQLVNPTDELTLADLLITKTQYHIVGGRYNRALETALEVEPLLKKHYREDNPKLAKNYGNLSSVCYYLNRYEEALQYRRQALNVYLRNDVKDVNHNFSFYVTYYNMGQLYYYLHEHSLATRYLQKALHIGGNIYGRKSPGMINILVQFGSTQQKLQKYDLAKTYFEEAYQIQKESDPGDYGTLAYIESFYGDVFADSKEYDSAAYYYNASIAHYRAVSEESSYYALFTRMGLASVYAETGNTAAALLIQKDVLKKFRKNFPLLKQPVIEFFNNISDTYLKAQQPDSARLYSDSSILFQTGLKSLPADPGSWLLKLPFSFKVSEQIKIRLDVLYEMYRRSNQKQYLLEILKTIEAYADHITANMYRLRTQHSLVEQSEVNKAIFSAGIDACWELSNLESKQYYAEKAFMLAEQGKALLLRLASNNFMVDGAMGSSDPIVKRDIALRKRISSLNEQYLDAENDADSLLRLMTTTIETYQLFQDSLKKAGNPYFNKRYAVTSFPVSQVRAALLKDAATLVEYALTARHLYTFVITQDSFYIRRDHIHYSGAVKALQNPQNLSARAFRDSAYRLYAGLIKPIEPYFASGKLIIVPDADLYYLNFETLVTDTAGNDFTTFRYLIHRYRVSYLLSADVAVQMRGYERAGQIKNKALLFAPVFTDLMKQLYKKQGNALHDDSAYLRLFRQPFALEAARNISSLLSADIFTEQQAHESAFKQNSSEYNILHLGTHAEANDRDPLQSRLFFARPPEAMASADDGNLYAYEIYSMQFRAGLAVLTACETGAGAAHSGEGVMSLAHSFMFAGCPSVVMSLWKIDEKTSAQIITDFYKYLRKGDRKSEALRKAKLNFIDKHSDLTNPFYWAGICIIGDDSPLYNGRSGWWYLAMGAGIAVAIWFFLKVFFRIK